MHHHSQKAMIEVSWCQIPVVPRLICDYTRGDKWLTALCQGTEHAPVCDGSALTAIEQTMGSDALTEREREHLENLRHGASVVIGGQQVGYWGGPLYTWLKIASIVSAAQRHNAVPVFWVEDNDHDIPEAGRVSVLGTDDVLYPFECPLAERCQDQTIVAACHIGDSVTEQLTMLASLFANLPFTGETVEMLRDCYTKGRKWSDAFIALHRRIWREHGVLFVRSSHVRSLGAMAAVIERELLAPGDLATVVAMQTAQLSARGYVPQLTAGDINAFYHDGDRRFRIYLEPDGNFRVARRLFRRDELLATLHHEPARFSPNAALRPIVQDRLFAPIATVLGPAELQYHLQLRGVYDRWEVPKPTLVLRHSASFVPRQIMRLIERHRDSIAIFFQPAAAFEAWVISMLDSAVLVKHAAHMRQTFEEQSTALVQMAQPLDPTLARSIAGAQHTIASQLQRLEHRILRALRRRGSQELARYRRAHVHLFPHGGLQERTIAPIHWMCAIGVERWRQTLLAVAQCTNQLHYIATPDELLDRIGTQLAHTQL